MYKHYIKRIIDIILSFCALILLLPVYILLFILSYIFMGRPVLFIQDRTSKNKSKIKVYKLRTMSFAKNEDGNLLPENQRKTKYSIFLRNSSLDELPQIWNIFIGDMSIIGPRPLLNQYNNYYKVSELPRFDVRGGLIPPEIMHNTTKPTWDEQLKWESEYANNCSVMLDLKIIFKVFYILFERHKEKFGEYERMALNIERKNFK